MHKVKVLCRMINGDFTTVDRACRKGSHREGAYHLARKLAYDISLGICYLSKNLNVVGSSSEPESSMLQ